MTDSLETFKIILSTQMIGITRVAVAMPIEHAFDRLKTHMQSHLTNQSFRESLMEIYQNKGFFKGIYAGFQPNFFRCVLKQYYRWPMMILIPNFYLGILPEKLRTTALYKTMTGITIALFESLIICPLERLKCLQMTRITSGNLWVSLSYQEMVRFLYTGFQIQIIRQSISWTSYLYWDHKIRHFFKSSPSEAISLRNTIFTSILTSFLNIALVHPFDTIKTLCQMENNYAYQHQSAVQALRDVYLKNGLRGLYAGWQMRILAFFGQSLLTTPTIDYLERQYGRKNL